MDADVSELAVPTPNERVATTETRRGEVGVATRVWQIVEVAQPGDKASRIFDLFILTLISLNVLAAIFGTVNSIQARHGSLLDHFEFASVIIFSIEYLARLWSCTAHPAYGHPFLGRLRFACRPMSIVDLLAVLPFYLPFVGIDLRFIRVLRLA